MAICQVAVANFCQLANMADMANRIRAVRKSKHMTLDDLAEASGISTSYLSRIETGQRGRDGRGLSLENAVKIARALSCEVQDVTDDFSDDDIAAASSLTFPVGRAASGDISNLTIHGGMGNGGLEFIEGAKEGTVPPEFIDGFWSFPERIRNGFRSIGKTHALPVIGDSMEPTIAGGSVVFVDTSHTFPSPPEIYAIDYGDGLMIKRIEMIPKTNRVMVKSDNPRVDDHEMLREDLRVFGRVVAFFQWRD